MPVRAADIAATLLPFVKPAVDVLDGGRVDRSPIEGLADSFDPDSTNDPAFVRLKQVEGLVAPDPRTIESTLIPKGQVWSRDSLAVSQGVQVAPHQALVAIHLSATVLENGIDSLEKAVRQSASVVSLGVV